MPARALGGVPAPLFRRFLLEPPPPRSVVSPASFILPSLFKGFSRFSLCGENGHNLLYAFKCCRRLSHFSFFSPRLCCCFFLLKSLNMSDFVNNFYDPFFFLLFFRAADRRMTSQLKWDAGPRGWEPAGSLPRRRPAIPAYAAGERGGFKWH